MTNEKTSVFCLTGQCSSPQPIVNLLVKQKHGKNGHLLLHISGYRTLSRIMQSKTSKKTRAQVAKQKSDLHQINGDLTRV